MDDLDKYGRHLQEVVDHVRGLPLSEQRVQSTPKRTSRQHPLDCRGVPILVGNGVVVADGSGRLHEETIKRIERSGEDGWWVSVHFKSGGWTTPNRCAVVSVS